MVHTRHHGATVWHLADLKSVSLDSKYPDLSVLPAFQPHSVISICSDSLRRTWLASDLLQTLTWSKPSTPGHGYFTPIYAIPDHQRGTNFQTSIVTTLKCGVFHVLHILTSACSFPRNGRKQNKAHVAHHQLHAVCDVSMTSSFITNKFSRWPL